jgi:hypothetical protein
MRYLDADQIADARNARGCGVPLDRIAGHLGVTVAELRAALGMPGLKPVPVDDEPDLFRDSELEGTP